VESVNLVTHGDDAARVVYLRKNCMLVSFAIVVSVSEPDYASFIGSLSERPEEIHANKDVTICMNA
jgi:hypothetical protein